MPKAASSENNKAFRAGMQKAFTNEEIVDVLVSTAKPQIQTPFGNLKLETAIHG